MMEVERPEGVPVPAPVLQPVVMEEEQQQEEEEEHSSALQTRDAKNRKMAAAAAEGQSLGEDGEGSRGSVFLDATKVSQLGAENQVTEVGGQSGQKDDSNETPLPQGKEIEKQDNCNAQETSHHSSNGKLENGSHSNGVHETSNSSETVTIADELKLIAAIRDGKSILPNWNGALDAPNRGMSTTEVHEIEVEKDENATKGKANIEEYDLEKILDEQETHDLYCPNCKSCITRRVILKKRKRTVRQAPREEPSKRPQLEVVDPSVIVPSQTANEDSPDVFRCLSCFAFFIPTGRGFNIFRIFERRDVNQHDQVQHSSASQQTSETCGSWLLSCFQTVDSPKKSNGTDSLKQPLLSGTDEKTSVEYNASSSHSHATNGKAEQSKKPSPDGLQTTTPRNEEVKKPSSEFHGAPSSSAAAHISSSWHSETGFIQIDAGHVVTGQPNESCQEEIPPRKPADETVTDTIHPGRKTDIQDNIPAASDNSSFFKQPIFIPGLKIPAEVLPGAGNLMGEKPAPASVIPEPVQPEAPPHLVLPVPEPEPPVIASPAQREEWDILKAIVYGGLVESITSLSVVSAAAASGSKTLDIFILGIANLIGGLPVIFHNIADLRNSGDVAESSEEVGHYWLELGRRSKYQLHMAIAILSYILFGLLPPVVYGLSFRTSDNRENKMVVVAAASLLCIALLAIGKAHVKRPRTYITTLLYYLSIGFSCSGLSYVAGVLITKLLAHFGLIDQGGASAPPAPPGLSLPGATVWASY